jgi:hypothetical protein
MGWYDYSLRNHALDGQISRQDYRRKRFQNQRWNDGRFVHWHAPQGAEAGTRRLSDTALTAHMMQELTQQLHHARQLASRLIVATHMLPFAAMLRYSQEAERDYFAAFMGSVLFGDLLQSVPEVEVVLSGHTHHQFSVQVGPIRIHTSPVGYPRQWQGQTPLAVARQRLSVLDIA